MAKSREIILTRKNLLSRVFPGWWTVIAGGLLALWGYGYQAYGISALFKPISTELGFTRAATSVASSLGRFEGGFESPLSGWITDRFGPRWITLVGVFLVSIGLAMMYFINSLWAFYVVWGGLVATGVNVALGVPLDTTISNWFVKKRGLAISLRHVFAGLSGVVIMPLVAWLITIQGWRMTCLIGGVVMAVIGLPLVWFCFKPHRPEYYGLLPDGAKPDAQFAGTDQMIDRGVEYAAEVQEVEFTLRQAMRTPAYWMIIVAISAHSLAGPALNIHVIPFLTDIGIDPLKAAAMMSIYVGVSIPFRFVGGFIADRMGRNRLPLLLGASYLMQAVGFVVFLVYKTTAMIYIWFVLYGIGMGIANVMPALIRARYFGRKAFGSIQGTATLFMTPVGVAAPIYVGWVYDTTGSYTTAFIVMAALIGLSAVIVSFIRPPKPPARITDVRKIV